MNVFGSRPSSSLRSSALAGVLMVVVSLGSSATIERVAMGQGNTAMTALHLAAGDQGRRMFLQSGRSGELLFTRQPIGNQSAWYIVPVAQDMVRIQQSIGNRWYALGVDPAQLRRAGAGAPSVGFLPLGNSAQQLWRIQSRALGGYIIENVDMPGYWLTCGQNGGLWLQAMTNNPYQVWWSQQPAFALPSPQYRNVAEQYVPNTPLPPAQLRVNNTHTETLFILLADRRAPDQPTKLRIPAGGTQTVTLERDSGGTIMQTVEVADAFGNWERYEYQIPVPPSVLYDMSVYEEFLQSIAIDRTGKSPNAIEDVNYQPRSVGFFLLPAGEGIPDSGSIDPYGAAVQYNNPGAVRRISPRDLPNSSSQRPPSDPLKDLLNQIQSKRGKF